MEGRIIQLNAMLANQISAGEVVERPASVVKELVENSLDAKATKIEIEIEGGGMHLIRIRDNGMGIMKADLMLAFARHATSKICSVDDLMAIGTLGFRGEALASIACISHCKLASATESDQAWQIVIAPDLTAHIQPAAHPQGTTIEVADLFYNTPARRKFLRSEKTEFQAIEEMVKKLALSYPQVSFVLKHQQRQVRCYPACLVEHQVRRIARICGTQFIEQSRVIDTQAVGLSLKGWIGEPHINKRQADCQYFFVNQRMVKDRLLTHAIKTVYQQHPKHIEGTYPCYVLYLHLSPHEMDVNVHPTKQEVRFNQARLVHDFITKSIEQVLMQTPIQNVSDSPPKLPQEEEDFKELIMPVSEKQHKVEKKLLLGNHYALLEEEKALTLFDLRQAKSTLLVNYFNQFRNHIPNKPLLFPVTFLYQVGWEKILNELMALGFEFRIEDQCAFLTKQPIILKEQNIKNVLQQIFQTTAIKQIPQKLAQILSLATLLAIPLAELSSLLQALENDFSLRLTQEEIARRMHDEVH